MNLLNLRNLALVQLVIIVFFGTSWCVNLYKLTQCDFQTSYKPEIIHAVGVFIPPAAVLTVFFSGK